MDADVVSRQPGETEIRWIMRVGKLKDDGVVDKTWHDLAVIFNNELRPSEPWTESAYRKRYASLKMYEAEFPSQVGGDDIVELRRELEKEKVKLRDERNAYNRLIRDEARKESYAERFVCMMQESLQKVKGLDRIVWPDNERVTASDSDLIIPLTDIHAGLVTNNSWNKFDEDVLKVRLAEYLKRVFEIQVRHRSGKAYVVISEVINGLIHSLNRVQSNQDVINQFLIAVEYITSFLIRLSQRFVTVNVYVAPGNHSRVNKQIKDDIPHENLDNLIIPFLAARLQNYDNVICHNNVEQGIACFAARGREVLAVHGDKDAPDTVADKLSRLFNRRPYMIMMGHRHCNTFLSCNGVKVVQSGSICGVDEYAISKRLVGKPEQMVCVMTDNGLECLYNIEFEGNLNG